MALPVLVKSWQLSANNQVAAQGSVDATIKRCWLTVKNILIGFSNNPWTVVGSSNGVTAGLDGVDRWNSDSDLLSAGGSSAHSWIVLKQTGISSNFQFLIERNSNNVYEQVLYVSENAGFTGGTTTARPTATDEQSLMVNPTAFWRNADVQYQIHVWQSTDGACTRIVACASGVSSQLLILEKPVDAVTGWTRPWYAYAVGSTVNVLVGTTLGGNGYVLKGRGSGAMTLAYVTEALISSASPLYSMTDIGTVQNSFSSEWPMFPIGLISITALNKGRHANVPDMWMKPTTLATGDTFPNDAANRQFVALGDFIFPWTGTSVSPALT